MVLARVRGRPGTEPKEVALRFANRRGTGVGLIVTEPPMEPLAPLDGYRQKVRRSRARGAVYPYEIVPLLTGTGGSFAAVSYTHLDVYKRQGIVRASVPAVLVAVHVKAGEHVESGATIAVLETMKMETPVRAPRAGTVREVLAAVNSQVDVGTPLVRLDRPVAETAAPDVPAEHFRAPDSNDLPDASTQARRYLEMFRAVITGYDVSCLLYTSRCV